MKKFLVLFLLLFLPLVSASLKIEKTPVIDAVISDLNNSAVFNFAITNLGATDTFVISSLVGAYFEPDTFVIPAGETKEVQIKISLSQVIQENPEVFNFRYRITGAVSGVQEDVMQIKVSDLKNAVEINAYNIELDSSEAVIYAISRVGYPFDIIKADFHSSFFDFSKTFSLGNYEKKEFTIPLNKEVTKKLIAGDYILTANIEALGLKRQAENTFKFVEKGNIATTQKKSGIIIRHLEVDKENFGNLPTLVQVKVTKNIVSRLFTTFNIEPSASERKGFLIYYTFQKEIKPSESLSVRITTNWFYPLILLVLLIIIGYLIKFYNSSDLTIKKHASFVRTKGGEFALKINLRVKAKKFVEKINIIDKMPGLVKVYEKFGAIAPSKIDSVNKRIEWYLDSLQENEERVLSYVIFSKVGVVGKFELPSAIAVYEQDGKVHETQSNKVFFLTETPKSV